jgi:hypothetical protein
MRLRTIMGAVLLLSCALAAGAQSEIASVTDWRMHTGDDPAWSQPELDDSGWARVDFPRTLFTESDTGWRWYRATFQVPTDFHGQQLSVGFGALDDVYQVFFEGVPVGQFGSFQPTPNGIYPRHRTFRIPNGLLKGSTGHIAIRRWRGAWSVRLLALSRAGNARMDHPPQLGSIPAMEAREDRDIAIGAIQNVPWDLADVAFLFGALISFVLLSTQRRKTEYLYLGLFCLCQQSSIATGHACLYQPGAAEPFLAGSSGVSN